MKRKCDQRTGTCGDRPAMGEGQPGIAVFWNRELHTPQKPRIMHRPCPARGATVPRTSLTCHCAFRDGNRPLLRHSYVVLPARLKQRKDTGYSEEFPYLRRQVHQLQFAVRGLCGDVKARDHAQAGAVHKIHLAQVNDNPARFRQQISDAFFQYVCLAEYQTPLAFHQNSPALRLDINGALAAGFRIQ